MKDRYSLYGIGIIILALMFSGCVAGGYVQGPVIEEIPFDGPGGWILTDVWIGGIFYPTFWTVDRTVIINNISHYRGGYHGHFIRHRDRYFGDHRRVGHPESPPARQQQAPKKAPQQRQRRR